MQTKNSIMLRTEAKCAITLMISGEMILSPLALYPSYHSYKTEITLLH